MSIFGRFRKSGGPRFVPRLLLAKTRVQLFVLGIDVQRRKTWKIDLNSIENRPSRPLGVSFDGRGRSVERLGATCSDSGWLGRPRSIGKAAQVARLGGLAVRPWPFERASPPDC